MLSRLGAGGMGVVFLAERSGRRGALKLVRDELAGDPEFRSRFAREAAAAAAVAGVCTARVIDADTAAPQPWMVTEYLLGPTLLETVRQWGPLRADQLQLLGLGLAEALTAIHSAGVVHRDLKPSNVVLCENGPKVIDFGIARAADATALTSTGQSLGTPGWMTPEQVTGSGVGPPVDVWAWGATMCFAATGRPPFGEGPADAILHRVLHLEPDLEGADPAISRHIRAALTKDPDKRPAPQALLNTLLPPTDHTVPTDATRVALANGWWPPPPTGSQVKRPRRMSLWAAAVAAVLVVTVAGTFLAWRLSSAEDSPAVVATETVLTTQGPGTTVPPTTTSTTAPSTSTTAPSTTTTLNPDNPANYASTNGSDPPLSHPDCTGAAGVCLFQPYSKLVEVLGTEDEIYPDINDASHKYRSWDMGGWELEIETDEADSVVSIFIFVEDPMVRVALPDGIIAGQTTFAEIRTTYGYEGATEVFGGEGNTVHQLSYITGLEGTEELTFFNRSPGASPPASFAEESWGLVVNGFNAIALNSSLAQG